MSYQALASSEVAHGEEHQTTEDEKEDVRHLQTVNILAAGDGANTFELDAIERGDAAVGT